MTSNWMAQPVAPLNFDAIAQAKQRQAQLTKPPGSLGRLESVAIRLAGMCPGSPNVDRVSITIFAGDHGVAEEGVSAFPQVVTAEMIKNFSRGGAAICVLSKSLTAQLEVVNLGTVVHPGVLSGVVDAVIAPSTANLCREPAMTGQQLDAALNAGRAAVARCLENKAALFVGGDMGIANTTSATAIGCALLGCAPDRLVGPGTGLNPQGVAHKAKIIERALTCHNAVLHDPINVLGCLGGFEIAALVGAYIGAAQQGLPMVVDGFIASAAALTAVKINPDVAKWMFLSHRSAEPGHRMVCEAIGLEPLVDLGMRLGEGSGAAVTVPLLRMACQLHNEMATFSEAEVSQT